MAHRKIGFIIWLAVAVLAAAVLIGCKEKPQNSEQKAEDKSQITQDNSPPAQRPVLRSDSGGGGEIEVGNPQKEEDSKPTLREIIAHRRNWTWGPAYTNWSGEEAPDFALTDITGKRHKLSQYRGRNVMLIFWATWCRPCIMEIPHLIELRNTIGEDKLAMLAISYIGPMNSTNNVKRFVAANPAINYTVISTDGGAMPGPYNRITSIPTHFFIDPEGKIKLATQGTIPLRDMEAIVEAEH